MKDEIQAVIWTQGQHIRELIKTLSLSGNENWEEQILNRKPIVSGQVVKQRESFLVFQFCFWKIISLEIKIKQQQQQRALHLKLESTAAAAALVCFWFFVNSVCWCWLEAAGWLCWRRELSARSELRKENDTSLTDVCAVSGSAQEAVVARSLSGKLGAVAKKERYRLKIHKTRETHQIRRKDWKQTQRQVEKIDFCSRTSVNFAQ